MICLMGSISKRDFISGHAFVSSTAVTQIFKTIEIITINYVADSIFLLSTVQLRVNIPNLR